MGIVVDLPGKSIRATTNLPAPNTAFTICGWARANVIGTSYRNLFGWENNTFEASNYINFGWVTSGLMNITHGTSSTNLASGPKAGEWFFWFVQVDITPNPDRWTAGFRTQTGIWVTTSSTSNETFTAALLILGNNSYDEHADVVIGPTSAWRATLTIPELNREMWQITPKRRGNLNRFALFRNTTDLGDYSGTGFGWAATGTLADGPSPPLRWADQIWIVPFVAAGGPTSYDAGLSLSLAQTISPVGNITAQAAASLTAGAGMVDGGAINVTVTETLASIVQQVQTGAMTAQSATTLLLALAAQSDGAVVVGQNITLASIMSAQSSAQVAATAALGTLTVALTAAQTAAGVVSAIMSLTASQTASMQGSLSLQLALMLGQALDLDAATTAAIGTTLATLEASLAQTQSASVSANYAVTLATLLNIDLNSTLNAQAALALGVLLEQLSGTGGFTDVALALAVTTAVSLAAQNQAVALAALAALLQLQLVATVTVEKQLTSLATQLAIQSAGGANLQAAANLVATATMQPAATAAIARALEGLGLSLAIQPISLLSANAAVQEQLGLSLTPIAAANTYGNLALPIVLTVNFSGSLPTATYEAELTLANLAALATQTTVGAAVQFTGTMALSITPQAGQGAAVAVSLPLNLAMTGNASMDAASILSTSISLSQLAVAGGAFGATLDLGLLQALALLSGQTILASLSQEVGLGVIFQYASFDINAITPDCRVLEIEIEVRLMEIEEENRLWEIDAEGRLWEIDVEGRLWEIEAESRIWEIEC